MTRLKIFRISQDVNNGYDTYDSAVVIARDENEARNIYPTKEYDDSVIQSDWAEQSRRRPYGAWCYAPEEVKVELIGVAKAGSVASVVVSSFNAG